MAGNRQCSMLVKTKTKTQLFDSLCKICLGMMISRTSRVIHVIYVVKEHPQENMHKWKTSHIHNAFHKKRRNIKGKTSDRMVNVHLISSSKQAQCLHCRSFQINCTSFYKRMYWLNSK